MQQNLARLSSYIGAALIAILLLGVLLSILPFLVSFDFVDFYSIFTDGWILKVIKFSFFQAFISMLFSVVPAIFITIAFIRQDFFLKRVFIKLLAIPIIIPSIILVFAIIDVYGREGLLNTFLAIFNIPKIGSIYGLPAILIAHLFFNISLASYLLIQAFYKIPNNYYKNAEQLGLSSFYIFKNIEYKLIKRDLFYCCILVFLVCFGSFTIVLSLGGGPSATTLEVAIYQAIKFSFEPDKAAVMASIQIIICFVFALLIVSFSGARESNYKIEQSIIRFDNKGFNKYFDYIVIIVTSLFLILPIIAIVSGLFSSEFGKVVSSDKLFSATMYSIKLAASSSFISIIFSLFICSFILSINSRFYKKVIELFTLIGFIAPAVILGAGWFLLSFKYFDNQVPKFLLIILIHIFITVPYSIRIMLTKMNQVNINYHKLATMLDIKGLDYFKNIMLRNIKPEIGKAIGISFCISLGDLGSVALFADTDNPTLTLYVYDLLASYRVEQAGVVASILIILCVLFYVFFAKIFSDKRVSL